MAIFIIPFITHQKIMVIIVMKFNNYMCVFISTIVIFFGEIIERWINGPKNPFNCREDIALPHAVLSDKNIDLIRKRNINILYALIVLNDYS